MKRAKSTICIKDLEQQFGRSDRRKQKHSRVPSLLPSSRSQSYLYTREIQRQTETRRQKLKPDRRVYCLEKKIVELQQQIQNSKASIKNYSKQLIEYQKITQNINQLEVKKVNQTQKIMQLKNQQWMMRQQKESVQFNANERVAEKEYFQELIESYKRQYQDQSIKVMQMIEQQEKVNLLTKEIQDLQHEIVLSQNKLRQWKEETAFDLNKHKIRNNIKMARMELIRLEDACDAHCNNYNLKKIRELCCQYFKIYAKKNGVGLEEAEDGVDLYFCRTGIVDDFRQFLSEKIIYNKPYCSDFDKYFETLQSIEKIYTSNKNKLQKNTHALQMQEVNQLKDLKQERVAFLNETKASIKKITVQIDNQFGMQSLAVIEYLRERNNNKYDIKEIKTKLKQNKKELNSRIAKIKQASHNIKHLDSIIQKDLQPKHRSPFQPTISCLKLQIKNHQQILTAIELQLRKLVKDKQNLQKFISDAVSKWRERQEKKDKLKQLYQQLSQAKQTNNYAFTRNEQAKEEPPVIQRIMEESSYSNKLIHRQSTTTLHLSKSVLALSNPFKIIMDRQTNIYQPIIQDCQMILSKQLNRHRSKQSNACDTEKSKTVKNYIQVESIKKTKLFHKSQKENLCENKTVTKNKSMQMSQTNYSMSAKPSTALQPNYKRQRGDSQKLSLSKLLLSKFNR